MQCLNPITIPTRSKYISLVYSQKLLQQVPCGQCVACETNRHNEWYFRTMSEFESCSKSKGYVLFDCLTYREDSIPRIGDYFDAPEPLKNAYCFDFQQVTNWKKLLRIRLERAGYHVKDKLKFFIAAEYGTEKGKTHRVHYHLLLFVYNSFVSPATLSRYISDTWQYGRTDGIVYKGSLYLNERCVIRAGLASQIRVCKYVAKYVQKKSSYQSVLDYRVNALVWHIFEKQYIVDSSSYYFDEPLGSQISLVRSPKVLKFRMKLDDERFNEFQKSPRGKKIAQAIRRRINQFHRQSHGFGESALQNIDYQQLERTGCLSIVDNGKPMMFIPLPTYYKRKLFFRKVFLNGASTWIPTTYGKQYLRKRERARYDQRVNDLELLCKIGKLENVDCQSLARYEMYYKDRQKAHVNYSPFLDDILSAPYVYNYSSPSDIQHYKYAFITPRYCGNNVIGYRPPRDAIAYNKYISDNIYNESDNDAILHYLNRVRYNNSVCAQRNFDHKQILSDVFKYIGLL